MKLALYARIACREPGGVRLATQIGSLREWAAARGHTVIREFVDDGLSGLRSDRPGLDALRGAVASHAFEAILVSTPDRLTRVVADGVRLIDELSARGCACSSLTDNGGPPGRRQSGPAGTASPSRPPPRRGETSRAPPVLPPGGGSLGGCCALRTDIPTEATDSATGHERYMDLQRVERDFRATMAYLTDRLRKANGTRAHALVTLMALKHTRASARKGAGLGISTDATLDRPDGLRLVTFAGPSPKLLRISATVRGAPVGRRAQKRTPAARYVDSPCSGGGSGYPVYVQSQDGADWAVDRHHSPQAARC